MQPPQLLEFCHEPRFMDSVGMAYTSPSEPNPFWASILNGAKLCPNVGCLIEKIVILSYMLQEYNSLKSKVLLLFRAPSISMMQNSKESGPECLTTE